MTPQDFGKYLARLRETAGYKNRESLYNASGIYPTTIKRLEEGLVKKPSIDILKRLSPYLKVTAEELMHAAGFIDLTELAPADKVYFCIEDIPDAKDRELLLNMLNSIREKHNLPKI